MTSEKDPKHEKDDLSAFFFAAQENAPQISADFLANLTQQAQNVQPSPKQVRKAPPLSLAAMFSGWLPSAGFASAALLGVWIGVNPPDMITDMTVQIFGASNLDDLAATYTYNFAILEEI